MYSNGAFFYLSYSDVGCFKVKKAGFYYRLLILKIFMSLYFYSTLTGGIHFHFLYATLSKVSLWKHHTSMGKTCKIRLSFTLTKNDNTVRLMSARLYTERIL